MTSERDLGFRCPHCGARTDVKDSRPTTYLGKATTRRRRKCRQCHSSITTYEVMDNGTGGGAHLRMAMLLKEVRRAHAALAALLEAHDELKSGNGEDMNEPSRNSLGSAPNFVGTPK